MTPAEYEEYVEELVAQLDFSKGAEISRNKKFPGICQPGSYEIDVAVRIKLSNKIDFLLIIECKNWAKRVDRPVIQKLVQTRDAISAHKAAVASPIGFTREAVDVAKAKGVALWVISEPSWVIISAGPLDPSIPESMQQHQEMLEQYQEYERQYKKRKEFISRIGLDQSFQIDDARLIDFNYVSTDYDLNQDSQDNINLYHEIDFRHECVEDEVAPGANEPGIDYRLAVSNIVDELAKRAEIEIYNAIEFPQIL